MLNPTNAVNDASRLNPLIPGKENELRGTSRSDRHIAIARVIRSRRAPEILGNTRGMKSWINARQSAPLGASASQDAEQRRTLARRNSALKDN